MKQSSMPWTAWGESLALSILPTAVLQVERAVAGGSLTWRDAAGCWCFVLTVVLFARLAQPWRTAKAAHTWPWTAAVPALAGAGAAVWCLARDATWPAWIALGAFYALLVAVDDALAEGTRVLGRWASHALIVLSGGGIPVAAAQVGSHFSDEELFAAVQGAALFLFTAALLAAHKRLCRLWPTPKRAGVRVSRRALATGLSIILLAGALGVVYAYQHSFFAAQVPEYPGISAASPFLCGEAAVDPATYTGAEVHDRLVALLATKERPNSPDYGFLALSTHEQHWADEFRSSILGEASRGLFTGMSGSVKSVQYDAALRAYYAGRVRSLFPDLFSPPEWKQLQAWFRSINRRALTPEPVDWFYALAFSKPLEGPYENQENGAGLLAVLETEGLADPALQERNRRYLERIPRGWNERFRNTDDALGYQLEWLTNAYFQSAYGRGDLGTNARLSFEWLLHQALPDGAPLNYNQPGTPSLAGVASLGAALVDDPRYVWLAGRAEEYAEQHGLRIASQPGAEEPSSHLGVSPTTGSCLLYGDSGLPNRAGPLAPDKIVFRDGWVPDSTYLLLNLRFAGWHRYRATNAVTLIYQAGALVQDDLQGQVPWWLPEGRSQFRDKRIPRENLSGLMIERSGLDAILHGLLGFGSHWAQHPPYYAEVIDFEVGADLDRSQTRLRDWAGWEQDRWVYFFHQGGPIVVVDSASGPKGSRGAVAWQAVDAEKVGDGRLRIGSSAEMVLVPLTSAEDGGSQRGGLLVRVDRDTAPAVVVELPSANAIQLATVFLPKDWVGAFVAYDAALGELRLSSDEETLVLRLEVSR